MRKPVKADINAPDEQLRQELKEDKRLLREDLETVRNANNALLEKVIYLVGENKQLTTENFMLSQFNKAYLAGTSLFAVLGLVGRPTTDYWQFGIYIFLLGIATCLCGYGLMCCQLKHNE